MLQTLLNVTIVIFMVGNLLEVGLRLEVPQAFAALRNLRFVVTTLVWCFVIGPALAVLLTKLIPLAEPYALGLVLLGMAPCSPAIPVMMRKSGGSLAYMSAFMLLAYAGTVVLMPFMVPWLLKGFTADPWTIAKPLLFFIVVPMVIGAAIRRAAEPFAEKAAPIVKKVTGINTLILCADLLWLYRVEIVGAVGAYAIATQILYYAVLGFAAYLLGFGLSYDQKAPMTLGICTRNVGPALATLMGVAGAPQGAITMCILAIFLGAILSGFVAAALLKRFCAPASTPSQGQYATG
ncbi:MAG TPA: bile acid:sodium symporter [Thermoanaerobaculia bacterium]|nr:bile acid:sodium symporter [Thermoanaerobaculia bacterium]